MLGFSFSKALPVLKTWGSIFIRPREGLFTREAPSRSRANAVSLENELGCRVPPPPQKPLCSVLCRSSPSPGLGVRLGRTPGVLLSA